MKKKSTLAALLLTALLSGSPASVMAQNYNFGQLNWKKMVDLFATALQHGKNFDYRPVFYQVTRTAS